MSNQTEIQEKAATLVNQMHCGGIWGKVVCWWKRTHPHYGATDRYYREVCNEFACLSEPEDLKQKKLWREVETRLSRMGQEVKCGRPVNLSEVFGVERMVLRLMPDERLLAKAWSIRASYRRLVPEETYKRYEASNPPEISRKASGDDLIKIREDAVDVMTGIHWLYINSNYRELRIERVKMGLISGLVISGELIVLLSACNKNAPSPLLMLLIVCLMGAMGAILSIGRRMLPVSSQNVSDSDPVIRATQFEHGSTGIVLSVCTGAVSALILYFLMVAGLNTTNGLMPKFVEQPCQSGNACRALMGFFGAMIPDKPSDFAKALCWSFVAGFAEKLVPDMLDRMAKNGKQEK